MSVPISVIHTGVANVASMLAGLRRAGGAPELTRDPDEVRTADHVVLPGVGAFGAGLEGLRAHGLADAFAERVREGRPSLAVCLGLQMLCRESEETPGVTGLSLIDAAVTRLPDDVRVPHIGWNHVRVAPGGRLIRDGFAYFANSYRVAEAPSDWVVAEADHGGPFIAALERGSVLACQFHPELSGAWGQGLLRRWIGEDA